MIKKLIIKYKEIITYIIFGGLTTLLNWAVYTVLVKFTPIGITISNAIAWVAGVLFAYITNKIWVFESRSFAIKTLMREFVSFVMARAFTGVIEIFGVPLLVKLGLNQTIFGIEGAISKILISVIVVILNYVFSKLMIFKKNDSTQKRDEI